MKKIVWITFAALTAIWTGLVTAALQLMHWVLATIGAVQLPPGADGVATTPELAWLAPWLGPLGMQSLQDGVLATVQGFNAIIPAAAGLGSWIAVLVWIVWGLGVAGLLILALLLHKLAGRRQPVQQTHPI